MIITRKDEVSYVTDDPKIMKNRFLKKPVFRKWNEDFVKDDGEVVSLERSEIVFNAGTLLNEDKISEILFFIQAGDIKSVEVSNQVRLATETQHIGTWLADVNVLTKKHKFILYASSVINAYEILKDFIELNYNGMFFINSIKELDTMIVLEETLRKKKVDLDKSYLKDEIDVYQYTRAQKELIGEETETVGVGKKFYKLDINISFAGGSYGERTFVVNAHNTDEAMETIIHYLQDNEKERLSRDNDYEVKTDFHLTIEKATPLSIDTFIPKEFSLAYQDQEETA